MAKRAKKLKIAIESYKSEIETHFEKLEKDMREENELLARYHIKEIDKSLIAALEHKISLLGENASYTELIKTYKKRLEDFKRKLGMD